MRCSSSRVHQVYAAFAWPSFSRSGVPGWGSSWHPPPAFVSPARSPPNMGCRRLPRRVCGTGPVLHLHLCSGAQSRTWAAWRLCSGSQGCTWVAQHMCSLGQPLWNTLASPTALETWCIARYAIGLYGQQWMPLTAFTNNGHWVYYTATDQPLLNLPHTPTAGGSGVRGGLEGCSGGEVGGAASSEQ